MTEADALAAAEAFLTEGSPIRARRHGGGRIHESFVVDCATAGGVRRCLLQRVNDRVFPDVARLMRNVEVVLAQLAAAERNDPPPAATTTRLKLIATREGGTWRRDRLGQAWRAYEFVEATRVIDRVEQTWQALEAGRAFGRFQRAMSGLAPERLVMTIRDFHHTPKRLEALRLACADDVAGRADGAADALDRVERHAWLAPVIQSGLDDGGLPSRVVHNDAKITNVLFDAALPKAACVTDLDTVMPGSPLHDVGDMLRTMTSRHTEDDPDTSQVHVAPDLLEALLHGYVGEARAFLTAAEIEALPLSGAVIAFEQAVRFLTDHLAADVYYPVDAPGRNLLRARIQIAQTEALLAQRLRMKTLIDRGLADGQGDGAGPVST
ncbi:MAG: N-acetylhexosamine 1-kinase [Phycisphaerae bacterium]|nr:N-acetylhexosamine 1-kinase [Phycisphaerae bacterium]